LEASFLDVAVSHSSLIVFEKKKKRKKEKPL